MCGRQKTNQEIHDQLIIDFSIQRELYLHLSLHLSLALSPTQLLIRSLCV